MTGPESSWQIKRAALRNPVGSDVPLQRVTGDLRVVRYEGVRSFDDGVVRFSVALRGAGSMDFHYEASTGELGIERVRGTDASTEILVFRHGERGAADFGLGDCCLDQPIGAFASNAVFGELELRRQRGPFRFADGFLVFEANFPRAPIVHYDGAHGALDVAPADGSLSLDTRSEHLVGPGSPDLRLVATPSAPGAQVAWQQVRGPRLGLRDAKTRAASLSARTLPSGEEAVFVVGAAMPRAVAVETVIVRHPG